MLLAGFVAAAHAADDGGRPMLMIADNSPEYQRFLHGLTAHDSNGDSLRVADLLVSWLVPRPESSQVMNVRLGASDFAAAFSGGAGSEPSIDSDASIDGLCAAAKVVVAVGPHAAALSGQCSKPMLMTLVARYEFDYLTRRGLAPDSAIYLETDPLLNLALVRNALPDATSVGVLAAPSNAPLIADLQPQAIEMGLRMVAIRATDDRAAVRQLRDSIDEIDALLLLPDVTLVTDWSLKPILLMTARRGIPVFGGFTTRYVNAGVTAAVLPNVVALQSQISATADRLAAGESPPPAYPNETVVIYNEAMVRTLGLDSSRLTVSETTP